MIEKETARGQGAGPDPDGATADDATACRLVTKLLGRPTDHTLQVRGDRWLIRLAGQTRFIDVDAEEVELVRSLQREREE